MRATTDDAAKRRPTAQGRQSRRLGQCKTKFSELCERLDKAIGFIEGLQPGQIDGSDDKPVKITLPSGASREFISQSLLLDCALLSFHFHCTSAYDILHQCGVESAS